MKTNDWKNFDWNSEPWKRKKGEIIDIKEFIDEHYERLGYDPPVVGIDSQAYDKVTRYTVAIVMHRRDRGSAISYKKIQMRKPNSLYEKLCIEVSLGIMAGFEIHQLNDKLTPDIIPIHIDVNSNKNEASGKYKNQLVGMVVAQGFPCVVKPDSWAASHLADRITRDK